jgi:hypothetical protein
MARGEDGVSVELPSTTKQAKLKPKSYLACFGSHRFGKQDDDKNKESIFCLSPTLDAPPQLMT